MPRNRRARTLEQSLLAALVAMAALWQSTAWAEGIDVHVKVLSSASPDTVVIQQENSVVELALKRGPGGHDFEIEIPRPTTQELTDAQFTSVPYRLVGRWGDDKEELYLKFDSRTQGQVNLLLMHQQVAMDTPTLNAIDALGTDLHSELTKYFRARDVHLEWRYGYMNPRHVDAIRSAKIWFDAAVRLAELDHSYYRMDAAVRKFLEGYETLATEDSSFSRRYRRYVRPGYVNRMLAQIMAAKYSFVGDVETLAKQHKYDVAHALNSKAIAALVNEDEDIKRAVAQYQHIDLMLLRNNASFLAQKLRGGNS